MRTLATVLMAALAATQATAQVVHTRPAAGRTGGGTVAAIAPPPPVIIAPGYFPGNYGDYGNYGYPGYGQGMAYYTNLPVVVLPDGRVYADFGRGYERIVRTCHTGVSYVVAPTQATGQPLVTQPTVVQPSIGVSQPLPYTPPVPNQQTASQQMLSQPYQQALAMQSNLINEQTCWGGNGRGQVYIARP